MPQLTAKESRITPEGVVFSGDARLTQDGVILTADEIIYRTKEQLAAARGHVVFTHEGARLLAEEVYFNVGKKEFDVRHFRGGQFPYYVSGDRATGTAQAATLFGAQVQYGETEPLVPILSAPKIAWERDTSVTVDKGKLALGDTLGIPVPGFSLALPEPAIRYTDVGVGYSSTLGAELNVTFAPPVGKGIRAGADLGLFSKRGVLIGPVATYDTFPAEKKKKDGKAPAPDAAELASNLLAPPGRGASGGLRTGYIHDFGDTGDDVVGEDIHSNRGFVEWQHHQILAPSVTFNARVNYWSDSEVTRDFRRDLFRKDQVPDTFGELYQTGLNHTVSLFFRAQANDYFPMQQRLPEIRFDGLPIALGAGIYHRLNASIAVLEQTSITGPEAPVGYDKTLRTNRADIYYSMTRPFSPREWLSLSPVVGGRATYYQRATGGRDDYARFLGEVGFDMEMRASSTWDDIKSPVWGVDGLRHLVTPRLSYRYIPDADKGSQYIPPIDDLPFDTYLQPLGLGNQRNIDSLSAANTLRIGIDNTLQTRDPVYGSRDLVKLALAADYHFSDLPAGADDHLSDLHIGLSLSPARWLQFDLYQRLDTSSFSTNEINSGLTIRDADLWWLRVGEHYLEDVADPIQEYTADAGYRFNEIWSLLGSWRYDARTSRFTRQRYGLRQQLTRVWALTWLVGLSRGDERGDDFSFTVRVDMTTF